MLSSSHYLSAMGIQQWELIHPERLVGFQPVSQSLEQECRLLLVANQAPQGSEILWLEKVLKSFHLELAMVRHITPNQFANLTYIELEWVWFAGCDPLPHQAQKQLHSPCLNEIEGNTHYRRALWQQICAHQGTAS